ncbi:MAG: AMP-binding protein [Chloroflexota bacterium]
MTQTAPVAEADTFQKSLAGQLPKVPNSFVHFPKSEIHQAIHKRFETIARLYPAQIAIRTPEWSLSYSSLNERANQIAHAIVEQCGPAPQQVAFLLPNDGVAIAVVLGILKAGKCYVPLDPLFPQERLAYMVADSRADVIIADTSNQMLAKEIAPNGTCFNLDGFADGLPTTNLDLDVDPLSEAYILYTSGTTGQPKGIAFCHRNLLHTTLCLVNSLRFSPTDRLTQLHSTSFAASVVDIYGALLVGGTVYPWDVKSRGFIGLADWLSEECVTCFLWIPTPFRHFMDTLEADEVFSDIRLVVMASEPLTTKEVQLHREHFGHDSLLVNQMGTSESYNYHLYYVDQKTAIESYIVPAGYPVSEERQVLILDETHNPVVEGEIGEIAICSPYMSLGYWQRDELSEEKFLPDSAGNARRIYLTGDLGKWRADGCLIHLGRKDFQVKVRGYRIEIPEIEKHLHSAPNVRDGVVVAQNSPTGDKELVAYVIPKEQSSFPEEDLKNFLAKDLPDYMVPTSFVRVDSFPTTATGKLDRMRLPAPSRSQRPTKASDGMPPQTKTERMLARLWAKLLGHSTIGIHDDWFELGGHSLTAARLFLDIEKETGNRLPMSTLFQHKTIAQQARLIDKGADTLSWSSLVPIQPNGSRPPLFLMHAHGGNVIGYQELASYMDPEQPVYGLQAMGLDGKTIVKRSLAEMAAAYLAEVRSIQPHGPYYLAGFCFGGNTAFEMAQQLHASGEEVAFLAMVESSHWSYPHYESESSIIKRLRYKIGDRVQVEWESATEDGVKSIVPHIASRAKRFISLLRVKTEERLDRLGSKVGIKLPHSQDYVQKQLEDVHEYAYFSQKAGPYPSDVLLLTAAHQPAGIVADPTLGWGQFVEGNLLIRQFPGYRIGLLDEPRVREPAALFKLKLEEAQAKLP